MDGGAVTAGANAAAQRKVARLDRDQSVLLVVDVQERLAPHVADNAALVARIAALVEAARRLGIPRFLTEHCAAQLGPVIAPLRAAFEARNIVAKTRFGAADHAPFEALLRGTGRTQVVVAGMEAHVCVMQTVLGLAECGFEPFVVGDAVGSRAAHAVDRELALARMRDAGTTLVGTEMALFEWARAGDDLAFRDVLALVKGLDARP
jgi:nicotinamidase-related amidase